MQTVLVLGASRWQVPLMHAAQALGLRVAATDRDPHAVGAAEADLFAPIDLKDIPATIAWARELGIAAVATDQTDLPVPTQAAVAEALDLRGPSVVLAQRVTHKRKMREAAEAAGILNPKWVMLREPTRLPLQWLDEDGPRIVIKPADSMGSRGVAIITDADEVDSAVKAALAFSASGEVLIEEFLSGTEVTIEGFVDADGPQILCISEKQHSPPPHRTAWHLHFPPRLPAATIDAIRAAAIATAHALGITSGPLHGEFMVTPAGVYLIEMANRGGGSGTSSHIIPAASGVDVLSLYWRQLLGETVRCERTRNHAVILRFLNYPAGEVTRIRHLAAAQQLPGTIFCDLYFAEGDTLKSVTNDTQRHGCAILSAPTLPECEGALGRLLDLLEVEIDGVPALDLYRQVYTAKAQVSA